MQRMEREIADAQRKAVERASFELKRGVEKEIERVAPSRRLRGVGRKGARIGARFDVKGKRNPAGIVKAFGPLHLIERATDPHDITPKRHRGRRGSARALKVAGVFRSKARHPGTTGKFPFAKGIERGTPAALKELRSAFSAAVKRGARR
jgi:hypothetical protein